MSKLPTFILNDETKVNCYNFRVKNAGIDLVRLNLNPVILVEHIHGVWTVIGRWLNIRIEGSQLLAEAEFDTEDDEAKKIAGKVSRGFIKGCSLGLYFDPKDMILALDGAFDLIKCEAVEGSIVAIPGLAAAVRLYAANGELLAADQIKLSLATLSTQLKNENKSQNMEKFNLSAPAIVALAAIGVVNAETPETVSAAIVQLSAKLAEETAATAVVKLALKTMTEVQVKRDVASAVLAGKITADLGATYTELGMSNYDLFEKTLAALPGKATLNGKVINSTEGGDDPKTMDEFEKLPTQKQLAFKVSNPDGYAAIFK